MGEFIWGRGALDMKNHLISVMEAVETLLEEGFEPERDVYLLFGDDEEVVASQTSGARALMQLLKERGVHLDCVLDEGGAILPAKVNGILDQYLAGIGVAEKGYADFEISVFSKGGHSSQPPQHTALGELADVIQDLENHQCKSKMTGMVYSLFQKIGRNVSYPARIVTCNLWLLKPLVLAVMKKIPPAASLIRTTTGATMAQGSPAANVLPQRASVTVNFRMMPGDSIAGVERHIRKVVRNKNIEVKAAQGQRALQNFAHGFPLFCHFGRALHANQPGLYRSALSGDGRYGFLSLRADLRKYLSLCPLCGGYFPSAVHAFHQ